MAASACGATRNQGRVTVVECGATPPTGSNIGRFRCYRRSQIDERRENDQRAMERMYYDSSRKAPSR